MIKPMKKTTTLKAISLYYYYSISSLEMLVSVPSVVFAEVSVTSEAIGYSSFCSSFSEGNDDNGTSC
jgi:hypothetical protein